MQVAEYVVKVHMGVDELCGMQPVACQEIVEGIALGPVGHAGVDYRGLACVGIPQHIAVDPEHIEYESADFHSSTYTMSLPSKYGSLK